MKNTFVLFALFFVLSSTSFAQTAAKDSIQVLSIAQFEKMATKKKSKIIDVRTPEEFASGHIAGAVNIPVQAADFAAQIGALDPAGQYAVYCRSGNRSQPAVQAMEAVGITTIYELESGTKGWAAEGQPLVR